MSSHKHLNIFENTHTHTMDELLVVTKKKEARPLLSSVAATPAGQCFVALINPTPKEEQNTVLIPWYNPTKAKARVAGNGTVHSAALIRDVKAVFISHILQRPHRQDYHWTRLRYKKWTRMFNFTSLVVAADRSMLLCLRWATTSYYIPRWLHTFCSKSVMKMYKSRCLLWRIFRK